MGDNLIERCGRLLSSPYVLVLVLLVLAVILRFVGIGDAPLRTDEIYHLLAGRSWADHGTLAMGDGAYTRARFYSMATGWFFEMFGPTPGAGRALAAVGGVLLIIAAALWTRRIGGPIAGWVAGILLCFSYTSITIAQFARFYTWHAFGVFVLSIATFALVTHNAEMGARRFAIWAGVALAAFLISLHLQDITMLVALALAIWAGLHLLFAGRLTFIFRSPLWLGATGLAGLLAAAFVWTQRHRVNHLWENLRGASAWSVENRDNYGFYIDMLGHQQSWLFYLLPIAAIMAWRRYRDATLFCVAIVVICLALHSIAGMKALRYIYYLFPFMFAIWGFAGSVIGPSIGRFVLRIVSRSGRIAPAVAAVLVMGITAVSLVVATDYRLTATAAVKTLKTGSPVQTFDYGAAREEVDWTPHLASLRALQRDRLLVATDSVRTLYYLQDYDLLLSKTELSDAGKHEFILDRRTGKRDISTGASVKQVVTCYPKGAIIVSDARWRTANVTNDAADAIESMTKPVKLPSDLRMRAYVWDRAPNSSPECDQIRKLVGA